MVTFDFKDMDRVVRNIGAFERQVPFALARALNATVEIGRDRLPDTFANHIEARNPRFFKAAMVTTGQRATKRRLQVTLYDRFGRGNLKLHAEGGTRRARGGQLAIPSRLITPKRTGRGVPKGMKPRNIVATVPKRALRIIPGRGIYVGVGGHLKALYSFRISAPIRADVPLHQEFERIVRAELPKQFRRSMREAMATAFKKK